MDLSRLSNDDLLALKSGDLSKLSNEALLALKESQSAPAGFGNARDLISGANRTIGSTIDAVIAGYNLMLPKSQEVQPLSEGMRSVGVDLDRPRSFLGMVGEYAMPGPGGVKSNIAQTLLSAAGGYAARQLAPDSVIAEMAGSIAAPSLAAVIPAAGAGITRTAFRGADQAGMKARVDRADALGAPLTIGTASQGKVAQILERLSGSVPGGVSPFKRAGEEAASAIKKKLISIAGGEEDDVAKAGKVIQKGLFDPDIGWTKRTAATRDKLYDKLEKKLAEHEWFKARGRPNAYPDTVAGAPEKQPDWPVDLFNDQVTLPPRTMGPSAGVSPGIDALNTRQFINTANKGIPGTPSLNTIFRDAQLGDWFEKLTNDLTLGNGKLPFAAVKRLRTEVGDLLGDPQLIGSTRRELLNDFYRVLSDDMRAAAEGAGALKEFNRANAYHKARIERIEDFYDTLYKKVAPEDVWAAVIGKDPKSVSRIAAIRKGLTPSEWAYIRKTVVTRMGQPVASAAKEGAVNFSAGTFLTNYERMKGTGALGAIFGTGQYRKDLDEVARYTSDLRASAEMLSNPAGTAGLGLAASVYYGALGMIGGGLGGGSLTALGGMTFGLVANSVAARLMNNQRFIHWLAQSTRLPAGKASDTANHLKRLPIIAGNDEQLLSDIQEYINAVTGVASSGEQ